MKIVLTVLTAQKGETETEGATIVGGKHVAFHFEYELSGFDKTELEVEDGAKKFLR